MFVKLVLRLIFTITTAPFFAGYSLIYGTDFFNKVMDVVWECED